MTRDHLRTVTIAATARVGESADDHERAEAAGCWQAVPTQGSRPTAARPTAWRAGALRTVRIGRRTAGRGARGCPEAANASRSGGSADASRSPARGGMAPGCRISAQQAGGRGRRCRATTRLWGGCRAAVNPLCDLFTTVLPCAHLHTREFAWTAGRVPAVLSLFLCKHGGERLDPGARGRCCLRRDDLRPVPAQPRHAAGPAGPHRLRRGRRWRRGIRRVRGRLPALF